MPKRTNPFQRLVYLIQRQLSDDSTVTESNMLVDPRTGSEVEVDIVVEGFFSGTRVIISLECTARKRPATREWINEMWGKHQSLPTNKLVLVSKSGFTKEADALANALVIDAITIDEARAVDWGEELEKLKKGKSLTLSRFDITPNKWTLKFDEQLITPGTELPQPDIAIESLICEPSGDHRGTLQQHFDGMVRDHKIGERIMRRWIRTRKNMFIIIWRSEPGTFIIDQNDQKYNITGLEIEVSCSVKSTPIEFQFGSYRDVKVAYATASNIFSNSEDDSGFVNVTIIEKPGKESQGLLDLPSEGDYEKRTFTALFPSKEDEETP